MISSSKSVSAIWQYSVAKCCLSELFPICPPFLEILYRSTHITRLTRNKHLTYTAQSHRLHASLFIHDLDQHSQ